ncbi:MAG: hypothetical protein E4H33_01980 [Anaerolineales bacterium]|nr:MAG: hypothetical protein E4H33_01980 [Anaerolineales bacterium]
MVRSFIEVMLGEVGRQLLFTYEANAYWINWIVVIYGFIMFASWMNLVRIYRYLIVEMAKGVHTSDEINRKKSNKKIRKIIGVPWEIAVESSPFPLIARIGDLVPKRKTIENLQKYLDEKDLADKTLKALQGEKIQRMAPSTRRMMQRELDERKKELAAKDKAKEK